MDEPEEPTPPSSNGRNIIIGVVTLVVLVGVYFGGRALRSSLTGPPAGVERTKPQEPPPQSATPRAEAAPSPMPPAVEAPKSVSRRRRAPAPDQPAAPAPAPTTGTLHVDSDVPGAFVFLDRQFVGKAPVTADGIAPGPHQLNASAEGYEGYSRTLEVAPGAADVMVRFKEVRLDETVAVVHKHRFGSSDGKLIATPRGIRYETTDRNDQFVVLFPDLEVFEVNYLEKNLRIKVRGGRTYNFTDRNPNADALFVFHRNVEKVRARIAKGDVGK